MQAFRHFQKKKALRSTKKTSKRREPLVFGHEPETTATGGVVSFFKSSQKRLSGLARLGGADDPNQDVISQYIAEDATDLTRNQSYSLDAEVPSRDGPRRVSDSINSMSSASVLDSDTPISPRDGSPMQRKKEKFDQHKTCPDDFHDDAWGYAAIAGSRVHLDDSTDPRLVIPRPVSFTRIPSIEYCFWLDLEDLRRHFPKNSASAFRLLPILAGEWSQSFVYARGLEEVTRMRIREQIIDKVMSALLVGESLTQEVYLEVFTKVENLVMGLLHTKIFTSSIRPQLQVADEKLNYFIKAYTMASATPGQVMRLQSSSKSEHNNDVLSTTLLESARALLPLNEKPGLEETLAFEQTAHKALVGQSLDVESEHSRVSRTPLDKLRTIQNTMQLLSRVHAELDSSERQSVLDLHIRLLAVAIIQANLKDCESALFYVKNFRFGQQTMSERHAVNAFQSALAYIQSDPCDLVSSRNIDLQGKRNRSKSVTSGSATVRSSMLPSSLGEARITAHLDIKPLAKSSSLSSNSPFQKGHTSDAGSTTEQASDADLIQADSRPRSKSISWFGSSTAATQHVMPSIADVGFKATRPILRSEPMARAESLPIRRMSVGTPDYGRSEKAHFRESYFPRTRSLDAETAIEDLSEFERSTSIPARRPIHNRGRSDLGYRKNSIAGSSSSLLRENSEGSLTSFAALPTSSSLWDFMSNVSWPWSSDQYSPSEDGNGESTTMPPPSWSKPRPYTGSAHQYMASLNLVGPATEPLSRVATHDSMTAIIHKNMLKTTTLPGTGTLAKSSVEFGSRSEESVRLSEHSRKTRSLHIPPMLDKAASASTKASGIATPIISVLPPVVNTLTAINRIQWESIEIPMLLKRSPCRHSNLPSLSYGFISCFPSVNASNAGPAGPSGCRRCQSALGHHGSSEHSRYPPLLSNKKRPEDRDEVARNEVGVQMLSPRLRTQLFGFKAQKRPSSEKIRIAKEHLKSRGLLDVKSPTHDSVDFELPTLHGTLEEHIWRISLSAAEPYLSLAKLHASIELPKRPDIWIEKSGWTRYTDDGQWTSVEFPLEPILTFDVETMYKESKYPVLATAASGSAWYSWISPWLLGESESNAHLIPLGDSKKAKVIVGHNVGFDRARIAEEYSLEATANRFLDTMSLHVATNGITSGQRPLWHLHRKQAQDKDSNPSSQAEEPTTSLNWQDIGSVNNLRDVAKLHLDIELDKDTRDLFGELDREGIRERLQHLIHYCATDVWVTHLVYCNLLDRFLLSCPHPASFAGQMIMGSSFLPVNESWEKYIANSEDAFRQLSDSVTAKLETLARETAALVDMPEVYNEDPWLRQLDWTKRGKRPKWFADIHKLRADKVTISTRSKVAPLLLKVSWRDYPLYHSRQYGWCYGIPRSLYLQQIEDNEEVIEVSLSPVTFTDSADHRLESLQTEEGAGVDGPLVFFKLPHKDGMDANVGSPFSKTFIPAFEDGTFHSSFPEARSAIEMNTACSYWISARERIRDQFVVWDSSKSAAADEKPEGTKKNGIILPAVITMGTVTRRAVENTWLTASNAKVNRVGSELKAMVQAPPGHKIVGADVDSEELWISSIMGDAQFGMHGATAFGWMTLEGSKRLGTDLHSKTAKILGISRDNAKVFNYARIYGAGQKYAAQLLSKFNPGISSAEAKAKAKELYVQTKGKKFSDLAAFGRRFWHGGTESFVFNALEHIALSDEPRTPALGCGITQALTKKYLKDDNNLFMTSRINWVVQSSGVDYLHLLIVGMSYLSQVYGIATRFMLSVHDEVRFLVKEDDAMRAALALQIANLWTRAFFASRLGLSNLPQSAAFFSSVDIDHVLRKEPDLPCVTPSNPEAIPKGLSVSINDILQGTAGKMLQRNVEKSSIDFEFGAAIPAHIPRIDLSATKHLLWLEAQAALEPSHVRSLAFLTNGKETKSNYKYSFKHSTVVKQDRSGQLPTTSAALGRKC